MEVCHLSINRFFEFLDKGPSINYVKFFSGIFDFPAPSLQRFRDEGPSLFVAWLTEARNYTLR